MLQTTKLNVHKDYVKMYINCFIKKIILESQIVDIFDYHRGRYWALNCLPKQSNVNALNNL